MHARKRKIWIVFDGPPSTGRPLRAHRQPPAHGPWLRLSVGGDEAHANGVVHALMCRGLGDLIVAAAYDRERLVPLLARMGPERYEIVSLPVEP